jgi:hypothetical protein
MTSAAHYRTGHAEQRYFEAASVHTWHFGASLVLVGMLLAISLALTDDAVVNRC